MAESIAFLCPGQGAQHVGMGTDLIAEFPEARAVFAEADDVLGFSLSGLCAEGPEENLMQTENAQPALLAVSVAIARTLAAEGGVRPTLAAGHSLGEWWSQVPWASRKASLRFGSGVCSCARPRLGDVGA
jgi:[acyl-carrier-protein] S-malonyltransferase